jgi:hypothetical protein
MTPRRPVEKRDDSLQKALDPRRTHISPLDAQNTQKQHQTQVDALNFLLKNAYNNIFTSGHCEVMAILNFRSHFRPQPSGLG